jgi:hypothetical protein
MVYGTAGLDRKTEDCQMSDFDNREEDDQKEEGLEEVKDQDTSDKKEEKKEYEDVCFICRRKARRGRCTIFPITSVSVMIVCTGRWMP